MVSADFFSVLLTFGERVVSTDIEEFTTLQLLNCYKKFIKLYLGSFSKMSIFEE